MRNLKEFKQALALGSRWDAYHYFARRSMGERTVDHVQSNAVTFSSPTGGESSWLYFPKASECRFDGSSVIVSEDGRPILRYTQVTKEETA